MLVGVLYQRPDTITACSGVCEDWCHLRQPDACLRCWCGISRLGRPWHRHFHSCHLPPPKFLQSSLSSPFLNPFSCVIPLLCRRRRHTTSVRVPATAPLAWLSCAPVSRVEDGLQAANLSTGVSNGRSQATSWLLCKLAPKIRGRKINPPLIPCAAFLRLPGFLPSPVCLVVLG